METTVMTIPDTKSIEQSASNLESQANALEIVDDSTNQIAQELLKHINLQIKIVEPELDAPRASAYEHYIKMKAWMDKNLNPFKRAKQTVALKIGQYDMKIQEQIRKENEKSQAKAEAEAKKKRDAEIAEAKDRKDKAAVEALKSAPIIVTPAAPKTMEPTKTQGVSVRYEWKLESIFNPAMVPCEFHEVSERKIKDRIKSLGGAHGIPGVKAIRVPITSGRV